MIHSLTKDEVTIRLPNCLLICYCSIRVTVILAESNGKFDLLAGWFKNFEANFSNRDGNNFASVVYFLQTIQIYFITIVSI